MKPIADRVVIERVQPEKSKGLIEIPDSAKELPLEGVVIAVGSGRYVDGVLRPLDVQVKDRVLFGKYAGSEVKVKGKDYLILREEEIQVVL